MSCIHFVGGEKGGVGKSVLARLLCQWLIDHSAKLAALDADPAHGALLSGYAGCCQAVDLSVFESADQIMDRALGASRDVVVDLPARSHEQLSRWLRESDVAAVAEEMGVRVVFWLVTDGSFASISTLETMLPQLAASAELVIVRNHRWTRDFSALEASALGRQVRERGGRLLDLPILDPALMSKLESRRDGFGFALRESPSADLSPMERQRVARWLSQGYAAVESIARPVAVEAAASTPAASPESAPGGESSAGQPTAEPGESQAPAESRSVQPAVGSERIDGARTWAEIGTGYQIYHVRYQ